MGSPKSFKFYAKRFEELSVNKAPGTKKNIRLYLHKYLIPYFGRRRIDKITQFEFEKYCLNKSENRKVAGDIKYFRAILNTARKMGVLKVVFEMPNKWDDPFQDAKIYSKQEIHQLLANSSPDLKLQIKMTLSMGMRKSEVLHFRYDFFDEKTNLIHLPWWFIKTRSRTDRIFPCSSIVRGALLRKKRGALGPHLFPSPRCPGKPILDNKKQWAKAKKLSGVSGRFHDFRHTCITNMIAGNIQPEFISKMLGLSKEMIRRYTHVPLKIANKAVNLKQSA